MKNSSYAFPQIIFFLIISILFTGCYSYYTVQKEDYTNLEIMDDIKIVYKNGKEFVVEKDDTTNVEMVGDSLVVSQGTEKKFIGLNEVERIRESRSNIGGTVTIIIVVLATIIVLLPPIDIGG